MQALGSCWERFADKIKPLLGSREKSLFEIDRSEYEALKELVASGAGWERIASELARLEKEPAERRLNHLANAARALAQRMGKARGKRRFWPGRRHERIERSLRAKLGGRISIRSRPGEGTTLQVMLPRDRKSGAVAA